MCLWLRVEGGRATELFVYDSKPLGGKIIYILTGRTLLPTTQLDLSGPWPWSLALPPLLPL